MGPPDQSEQSSQALLPKLDDGRRHESELGEEYVILISIAVDRLVFTMNT